MDTAPVSRDPPFPQPEKNFIFEQRFRLDLSPELSMNSQQSVSVL
jgi:hypothetical protein